MTRLPLFVLIVVCLVVSSAVTAAPSSCIAGQYLNGSACIDVPRRYIGVINGVLPSLQDDYEYVSVEGANSIRLCPAGTYSHDMGSGGRPLFVCSKCPPNQMSDSEGQTSCFRCRGQQSEFPNGFGSRFCVPCPIGSSTRELLNHYEQNTCFLCPPQTYNNQPGVACAICYAGSISVTDSFDPMTDTHRSSLNSTKCFQCPLGRYFIHDLRLCEKCPIGMYGVLSGQSSASEGCAYCPTEMEGKTAGLTSCNPCPAGSGRRIYGSVGPVCEQCPKGWFNDRPAGGCRRCEQGSISISDSFNRFTDPMIAYFSATKCFDCPIGRYWTGERGEAAKCEGCPAGRSNNKSASIDCPLLLLDPAGVVYDSLEYRSLDAVLPSNTSSACQGASSNFLALPADGWQIAPNNAESMGVIKSHPWGTLAMAVFGGSSYYTSLLSDRAGGIAFYSTAGSWGVLRSDGTGGLQRWTVDRCDPPMRVLLVRDPWGTGEKVPAVVPSLPKTVIYQKRYYRTLDNISPSSPYWDRDYMSAPLRLPVGWDIAGNNEESLQVIRAFKWGTSLMVLADGNAFWTGPETRWQKAAALQQTRENGEVKYFASGARILIVRQI